MVPCMTAWLDAEVTRCTNDNSLIQDEQRYPGAAVVSVTEIIWAKPLLTAMSAQKAELAALTKAFELRKDQRLRWPTGVPLLSLMSIALFI